VQYLQAAIATTHCQWEENNGHLLLFDLHPTERELLHGAFAFGMPNHPFHIIISNWLISHGTRQKQKVGSDLMSFYSYIVKFHLFPTIISNAIASILLFTF